MSEVIARERSRLRRFIRRRVPDPHDAEDILQDVLAKLVEANRLLVPIDHVTAWLFRVARNRIADAFRARRTDALRTPANGENDELALDELLVSPDAGPDAVYMRSVLLNELEQAIRELPPGQRAVFIAHEIEGKSFKQIAAETGVNLNTLLSRKRYAVLQLRERLQTIHDEFSNE